MLNSENTALLSFRVDHNHLQKITIFLHVFCRDFALGPLEGAVQTPSRRIAFLGPLLSETALMQALRKTVKKTKS